MSEIRSQATPARDKSDLADIIHIHVCANNLEDCIGECRVAASDVIADGWSKPRTVNSAAELDALPVGSVVWTPALAGPVGHIFVKCAGMWIIPWHDTAEDPLEQNGSVTVIFTPGEAG